MPQISKEKKSEMRPIGIIIPLIFIATCAFFSTNEALNEAQTLQKLIWSPNPSVESDQLFDSSITIDKETDDPATFLSAKAQRALRRADKIKSLPGQPGRIDFAQYSGYIPVDKPEGRELFYYFVESPKNSSDKPLVVWFNGGPGCSSLGIGAMEEVGPFRVNADGKSLSRFKYAWNNLANILFVESPGGVGFSKAKAGQVNGDVRTAKEHYAFLVNWLDRFPNYKNCDLYLTGESYAGHYIPQLADLIQTRNALKSRTIINLKGALIGNAFVNIVQNRRDQDEFMWRRDFITDEAYVAVKRDCDIYYQTDNFTTACLSARLKAFTGDLDEYNIYAPVCLKNHDGSPRKTDETEQGVDPCVDVYVENYLNIPEVKKAFHADPNIRWGPCNDNLNYTLRANNTIPTIKKVISNGLRMMLYSGDIDSVVPITNTKKTVKALQLRIKTPWRPWNCDDQPGGFVEEYQGLSLVTIRGAGHMVAMNQPLRAYTMVSHFLEGKPLPEAPLIPNNKITIEH